MIEANVKPAIDIAPDTSGRLVLDVKGYMALVDGELVPLTQIEFLVLKTFVANPFRVFSREDLADAVNADIAGANVMHSVRSVDLHIFRLRRKLRLHNYDCIHTLRSVGYRFDPKRGAHVQ